MTDSEGWATCWVCPAQGPAAAQTEVPGAARMRQKQVKELE